LYFGYVENYSLFVTSVCAFVLVGLLVAQGRLWRGWLLVPLGAAIFFHIMGVTLIPGAVYLLLAPTRLGQRARGWPPRTWAALAVLVGAAGFSAVAYFRHTSVFFRLAVLPLYDGRLTNGYTVLSPAHLGDFLNLIPLLLPAAGLLALALVGFVKSRRPVTRPFAFLVVAVLSTLGAAFIFEPELGMPRDWDLFAFAGVPLVVGFYYLVLNGRRERRPTVEVAALGILLGAAALGGRVATLRDEQVSLRPIAHYIALDPARMSPVFHILREYYAARGDALAADSVEAEWRKHNPEAELTSRAVDLIEMGQYAEAAALARRAIEINAAHWSGYAELGAALIRMQRYDSALSCLQMAGGLNPYSPRILHNLALCYDRTGDWRKAEQLWQKAYRLDTTQTPTLVELCRLYQIRRLPDKLLAALERLADQPDAPPEGLAKLADMYAEAGRLPEAGEVFRRAVQAGLDTALARQIVAARPRLKSFVPGFP
ncbi:MAG TPA: tetratricopeptide repeat protein, partial [candidate division Zixibacteria bacterium]|nr:tetratricopeptide repeat protein [candidate division Zixibacteria bacterium]